jgi:PAS domain S-box-containing protein
MRTPQQKLAHGDLRHSRRSPDLAETAADSAVRGEADLPDSPDGTIFRKHADALFGDAPDGVTLQLGGRIVYANRRMAELIGHRDPDRLLGLSSLHFYSDDDLAPVLARLQSTFFGRPASPARHELRRRDGTKIQVEATCLLLSISRARVLIEIVRSVGSEQFN